MLEAMLIVIQIGLYFYAAGLCAYVVYTWLKEGVENL